jgi:hypothetical protein
MEAVAATCLGKRPDRVAFTRSPSRRRMTEICATPPFHPERRLPAQTVAGVSGRLVFDPGAIGDGQVGDGSTKSGRLRKIFPFGEIADRMFR